MRIDTIQIQIQDALSEIERLRDNFAVSKKYPFFIGEVREFEDFIEINETETSEIIIQSNNLNIQDWFNEREKEIKEQDWFDFEEISGVWENSESEQKILPYILEEASKMQTQNIYIGLADISEAWMLPAFLRYGDWNECPSADVHCSVMRYWGEKYGAEILSISDDVIECTVKNPPKTREEAMKLAREQYLYCADIVDQRTQTLSNLGAELLNSNLWFFWWD
jgi:hypothetical protein